MPVDTLHPDYERMEPRWKRMRHVLEGEDAVKEAGTLYLPALSGQSPAEYTAYKTRAQFFNATGRHHQSLQGFIFRKNPTVTVPDSMAPILADFTMQGLTAYDYTKIVVREVLGIGRFGSLVDWNDEENRPYCVGYQAEAIRNWRVERVRGQMLLTLLVLFERDGQHMSLQAPPIGDAATPAGNGVPASNQSVTSGAPDEFSQETFDQWRVYTLHESGGELFVRCQVYRRRDDKGGTADDFDVVQDFMPTRRGIPLARIPFVFHGPSHGLPEVDRIPLEDMALVNLSLYRTSADLEHGRHFTGLPTPWASGFPLDKGELKLGSTAAWVAEDAGAQCGFLEFTGAGLQTLEKAAESKKAEMAALGARMLEPEAKKAEAFDTVAVRSAAETSALMNATVATTQSMSEVLRWLVWWTGTAESPRDLVDAVATELNTEFTVMTLPADMMGQLVAAYLSGAMDWESFFWKMQQGEMFPPDAKPEEVLARIQNGKPPGIQMPPEPPPGE